MRGSLGYSEKKVRKALFKSYCVNSGAKKYQSDNFNISYLSFLLQRSLLSPDFAISNN